MVGIPELWLSILLSAVIIFIASCVIHMALRYHKNDQTLLPGEEGILEAMRKAGVGRGNYRFPYATSMADFKNEEFRKRWERGPVGFVNVFEPGPPRMGRSMVLWFVYCLIIGVFVAYVTGRACAPGTPYPTIFRIAGTAAILGYAGAVPVDSIWKGATWRATLHHLLDGVIYGLLTAGTFGWLWPR